MATLIRLSAAKFVYDLQAMALSQEVNLSFLSGSHL